VRKNLKDSKGTASPIQSVVAFSIVLLMLGFYFAEASKTFVVYENERFDTSAKAIDVTERLLSDPGKSTEYGVNWERNPKRVTTIGLCAVPSLFVSSNTSSDSRSNIPGATYSGAKETKSNDGNGRGKVGIIAAMRLPDAWYWDPKEKRKKPLWFKRQYRYNHPERIRITRNGNLTDEAKKYFTTEPEIIYIHRDFPNIRFDLDGIGIFLFSVGEDGYSYEVKGGKDFLYAILDENKLSNLTKVDYGKAKDALGIDDNYDFAITVKGIYGTTLIYDSMNRYFKNGKIGGREDDMEEVPEQYIPPTDILSVCTRNVLIRHPLYTENGLVYLYEPARMSLKIFI